MYTILSNIYSDVVQIDAKQTLYHSAFLDLNSLVILQISKVAKNI